MPPIINVSSHLVRPANIYLPRVVIQVTSLTDSYMVWASAMQETPADLDQAVRNGRLTHDWACAIPPTKLVRADSFT